MTTKSIIEPMLLVDANRGIHIPQFFCQNYAECIVNMNEVKEDFDICLKSIDDNEFYWDAWQNLLDNVVFEDKDGNEYTLDHNDDLWAIPAGYEWPEDQG